MRLTLRTLLAWLDDTLPPEEVREIGSQVSGTPYAQELIERIRKVTRRRRLTVPPNTGPEAVDPNTVAAYLDNELEAEKVAEYEKLCLSSDVHLAEAASSHQILSLIKNKAKVPPESRYRMYRLFKGPEAVRTNYKAVSPAGSVVPSAVGTIAEPPWTRDTADRPSILERYGPPAIAVALIVVLVSVGILNLRHADVQLRDANTLVAVDAGEDDPMPRLDPDDPAGGPGQPVVAPPAGPPVDAPGAEAEGPEADADAGDEAEAEPAAPEPAAPLPAGAEAVVERVDGVLLRATRNAGGNRAWERLESGDTLDEGDRVVNFPPLWTTLALGPMQLTMVSQSELRVVRPDRDDQPRVDLIAGDFVLKAPDPGRSIAFGFEGRSIVLEPPAGQPIGLSWLGLRTFGEPSGRPMLAIYVAEGTLSASIDGEQEPQQFRGPALVSVDPDDGFLGAEPVVMPAWVVDSEPQPAEIQAGEAFASLFGGSTGSITFTLLEGMEDPDPTIRRLSVFARGAMAQAEPEALEQVMTMLNREGDRSARAAAMNVVMLQLGRGEQAAGAVREYLERFVAPPEAAVDLDRLLTGFPQEAAGEEALYEHLVADLGSENPSVRQLALETLQNLTGREDHGYDPDEPEGEGLKFWQDLLKQDRLAPARLPGPPPASPNPGAGVVPGDRRE